MMLEHVAIDDVVHYLNEILALDSTAVSAMLNNRVRCNQALADHPTVQVGEADGGFYVGLLGIINGMFGAYDDDYSGPICCEFDNGTPIRFRRTRTENE